MPIFILHLFFLIHWLSDVHTIILYFVVGEEKLINGKFTTHVYRITTLTRILFFLTKKETCHLANGCTTASALKSTPPK